mgnify:CR=1 FL=1
MLIATKTIIIACVILLLVSAGVITLEVYLSRRESKVPGLVLGELFVLPNVAAVAFFGAETLAAGCLNVILRVFLTLLPTIVLLVIYFLCRRGMNRKKQIEKMNIQDL